jgi:antitoxin component YwqK of YwqJK toxin-antitoxin module
MIHIKRLLFAFAFFASFFISEVVIAQNVNQFDENKQRTGVWEKKYPNNKIRYSGAFENGKEIGVFKFYDISGSEFPTSIKTYSTINNTILGEFFSIKGKLQSKGYFVGKDRIGNWIYYFIDGKIMSEEIYKDGKLEGKLVNYYPNGKATEITFYKDGLKDGLSQKYSSNGILIEEITFKKGKSNGLAKYFELNGNLKEAGSYKDGKRVGEWEYYLDGEVADKKELEKNRNFKKNEKNKK